MRALLAGCLILSCWLPRQAQAQDSQSEARLAGLRSQFERAADEFERGLYASAAEHFAEVLDGLRALDHPRAALVLFNLGRSHEELGDYPLAIQHYEAFLAEAPADAPSRGEAADRLAELRRRIRSAPPETRDSDSGRAPSGGDSTSLWVGAIASYGVAAVAFITMGVAGGLALDRYDSAMTGCGATTSCTEEQVSDIRTLGIVSDVGLGVGAAAVVAGTVFLILGLTAEDGSTGDAALLPAVGPGEAGINLRGTF